MGLVNVIREQVGLVTISSGVGGISLKKNFKLNLKGGKKLSCWKAPTVKALFSIRVC